MASYFNPSMPKHLLNASSTRIRKRGRPSRAPLSAISFRPILPGPSESNERGSKKLPSSSSQSVLQSVPFSVVGPEARPCSTSRSVLQPAPCNVGPEDRHSFSFQSVLQPVPPSVEPEDRLASIFQSAVSPAPSNIGLKDRRPYSTSRPVLQPASRNVPARSIVNFSARDVLINDFNRRKAAASSFPPVLTDISTREAIRRFQTHVETRSRHYECLRFLWTVHTSYFH